MSIVGYVVGYIFIGCLTWRIGEAVEHTTYDDDTILFAISLWWFVWIYLLCVLIFVKLPQWIVKGVQIVFVTIKYTIIAITKKKMLTNKEKDGKINEEIFDCY